MLAMNKHLTSEQRLFKAVVDITNNPRYRALAGILMLGDRCICETTPTACTNGRDEKYGREFVDSLSDAELRFVVIHENYHKLYRHLTTWSWMFKEDPESAAMACDRCINIKIEDDNKDGFAKMPSRNGKPLGLINQSDRFKDSAAIYKEIRQDKSQDKSQSPGQGQGFDDHDWEGAKEMSESDKQQLSRDLDEAVRQGALMAGKTGSGGNRDLDELLQPEIDWREVLLEFVTETCAGKDYSTWKRPNRRFIGAGIYMPSGISETVDELVIAIDTSGSVGSEELRRFLSEVAGIAAMVKPSRVRLLYWDTRVCGDETYENQELPNIAKSTKPQGGGGTVVRCVTDYMTEHSIAPQAVVVFTDGYIGEWGVWNCPVLWCIVNNKRAAPSVGRKVNLNI